MIEYEYECSECKYRFEIEQSIKDKPKKKCPNCKQFKLYRLIFPSMVIDLTPKTVGSLAEKNTYKKMGNYERQEKQHERKEEMKQKRKQGLQEVQKKLPKGMSVIMPEE